MKKNLSEEFKETDDRLVFKPENDICMCDSEGNDLHKGLDDVNKETVKDLKAKIKLVDKEINNAEAEKVKMKDGTGKKNFKVEHLERKLTLEEPTDSLIESTLNEAPIPPDLAKGYKHSRYPGGAGRGSKNTDLQKATYTKLTPEEALDTVKKDPSTLKDLRLIMDGKLVKLRDTGYGELEYNFRNNWLSKDKAYVRRNGDLLRDTAGIHYKNLFKTADAIYITNETSAEVQKDPDLLAARKENPESPNYNYYDNKVDDIAAQSARGEWWGYSGSTIQQLAKSIKNRQEDAKRYEDAIKNATSESDKRYYERELKDTLARIGNYKDKIARMRNAASEMSLRKPIFDYKELRRELRNVESSMADLDNKENKIKSGGSQDTKYAKEQLDYYNSRLEDILKEIAKYEMQIEDAPQKDAAKLKEIQDLKKQTLQQQKDLQAKKAAMFSKKKKESLLYQQIEKANLVEEFEDLLDTIYPRGYDDANVCEALENEHELITESLELEVENED